MTGGGDRPGAHDGVFHRDDEELLAATAPFLLDGLEAGETAVVVCGKRCGDLLVDALPRHDRLHLLAPSDVYERPAGAVANYQHVMERYARAGVSRVRVVVQLDHGGTPAEWMEWSRFDAVLEHALGPYPMWIVCTYDRLRVPEPVLVAAALTHRHLRTGSTRTANPDHLDPAEFLRRTASGGPDPIESGPPVLDVADLRDLGELRGAVRRAALAGCAMPVHQVQEFVLAINEVATNALLHGRSPVGVRLWAAAGRLVCTVTDRGAGFDDPFAGYLPGNDDGAVHVGTGLFAARQVCDRVDFEHVADGFSVRLLLG
ncbi:sensor histidine kinase [Umezawaea beigongshangensis]|uniref:sensor histidine kinase n=1 Tax=Umezawaea beigongshangensis TaxID=2780383 RepID=UPI0018F12EAB|nr:sensor histidine kinase [Umezawaea beigongshangensis]